MSAQKAAITSLWAFPASSPQLPQLAMETSSGIAMCASCWMRDALRCPCDQSDRSKFANALGCSPFGKGPPEVAEASIASRSWVQSLGFGKHGGNIILPRLCFLLPRFAYLLSRCSCLLPRLLSFCQGVLPFVKVLHNYFPFAKGSLSLSQTEQYNRW